MRVLIISWFFPPANTMGALRVGKFADYLVEQGHDVRVVTADFLAATPPLDAVPSCRVVRTRWWDVNALPRVVARGLARKPAEPAASTSADRGRQKETRKRQKPGLKQRLAGFYEALTNFPDKRVGWIPHAVRAGRRELADFDADVIFATAPPFSAAVAGAILSRLTGKPYVIEMRDRWSDDPYRSASFLRGWLERRVEAWVMKRASGIVTVSEPWAHRYAARDAKPVEVVLNGYDPKDIRRAAALPARDPESNVLVISHVGRIYPGRRDPSALFDAIGGLGQEQRRCIRVEFVGEHTGIAELAGRYDVQDNVVFVDPLAYHQALRHQMDSDVVVLLQWNDPTEQGNVPGKLFEYLATRRPILGHGLEDGVPATIITKQGAGLYSNNPEKIRRFLLDKLQEKQVRGAVQPNPPAVYEGFDRQTAYDKLVRFLDYAARDRDSSTAPSLMQPKGGPHAR